MEHLQRIVDSGGQILRVETDPAGLILTFDVGLVRISGTDQLEATQLVDRQALLPGTVDASEEEPWWRFLGNALTGVWPEPETGGLRLRFRASHENPKVVRLRADRVGVAASVEA